MIASYKMIFFDAGGTLFRPHPSVGEIYQEVAARHGCDAKAEQIEKKFRKVWLDHDGLSHLASHSNEKIEKQWWRDLVREVFSEMTPTKDFEIFFEELYHEFAHPSRWRLYPETFQVLKELKKRGKRLAVVSNWDSRLLLLCEGLELNDYFDFILISAVFGAAKPSPKIFQEALRRAQVRPEEAVHIGDSLVDDVQGASSVGMGAIFLDRHISGAPRDFQSGHKVTVIKGLDELLV